MKIINHVKKFFATLITANLYLALPLIKIYNSPCQINTFRVHLEYTGRKKEIELCQKNVKYAEKHL